MTALSQCGPATCMRMHCRRRPVGSRSVGHARKESRLAVANIIPAQPKSKKKIQATIMIDDNNTPDRTCRWMDRCYSRPHEYSFVVFFFGYFFRSSDTVCQQQDLHTDYFPRMSDKVELNSIE